MTCNFSKDRIIFPLKEQYLNYLAVMYLEIVHEVKNPSQFDIEQAECFLKSLHSQERHKLKNQIKNLKQQQNRRQNYMTFDNASYPYRILAHTFLDLGNSIFSIEQISEKKIYKASAAEIVSKPYFKKFSPQDIAAVMYTFVEEQFIEERIKKNMLNTSV